jgi:hypothetical protein
LDSAQGVFVVEGQILAGVIDVELVSHLVAVGGGVLAESDDAGVGQHAARSDIEIFLKHPIDPIR